MAAYVRLLRGGVLLADEPIVSAQVSDGINRSGTWSATIPANSVVAGLIEQGDSVQIVYNGRVLMEGRTTVIDRKFIGSKTISVNGYNDLDVLYQSADNYILARNEPILFPVGRILRQTDWKLTDISTMDSPMDIITLDVRNSNNRATQIAELLKASRLTNFRRTAYGMLEVGRFNRPNGYLFTDPSPSLKSPSDTTGIVTNLDVKEDSQDIIGAIAPLGGEVEDAAAFRKKVNLSLQYVVDDDPTLEYAADFPIEQTLVRADYRVYNRALGTPGGKKIAELPSIVGGTITDSARIFGDVDAGGGLITSRSIAFLIKPLHGYLKNVRFYITRAVGATALNSSIMLYKVPAGTSLTLSNMNTVYANRATDPLVLAYNDYTSMASIPVGVYEFSFEDGEVSIAPDDRVAILGVLGATAIDQQYVALALHSLLNFYTTDMDGAWQFNDALGVGAFTFNNDNGLMFTTESYATGVYRTENINWSNYRPNNDGVDSTLAEKLEASKALYQRTIAELSDNALTKKTYSMRAIVDIDFPKIGEKVRVQAQSRTARIDKYTRKITPVIRSIDAEFMVQSYDLKINNSKLDVSFSIVEGDGITNVDRFLFTSVYDQTKEPKDKNDTLAGNWFWIYQPGQIQIMPISGLSDTVMSNGDTGKLIVLDSNTLTKPVWTATPNTFLNTVSDVFQVAWPYPDLSSALNIDTDIYLEEVSRIEHYGDVGIYKISTRKGWLSDYSLDVHFFLQWEI